nr:DUF434 domain-containing protein [Pyrodictium delaneyi]
MDAFYDLFFLLTRGYPRGEALELVKRKYGLSRREAILLARCIHSENVSKLVKNKLVIPRDLFNAKLVVDGFNQLATIYAALMGVPVFVCSDGLTRDALLSGPRLVIENIRTLAGILADVLRAIKPGKVVIVLDSQPSHSGDAAAFLRRSLNGLNALVEVSRTADKRVIEYALAGYVAASSDIAIVMKVGKVFDLAGFAIRKTLSQRAKVNIIPQLLETLHSRWCVKRGGGKKGP